MRRASGFIRAQAADIRASVLSIADQPALQTRAVTAYNVVTTRLPSGPKLADPDPSLMRHRRAQGLAGLGVPDAGGLVFRRGDDAL